jgi:tRNA (guanine-N7-)-methyltransferase
MKARVRHHVNPLRSQFHARRLATVPLPPGEVEVELGCADARFLFERAPAHPKTTFVGLEIRAALVAQVNREARELGLGNLRAHFAHVNVDLDALFEDERLARVYINFPDPWFKRRHHKRRLMSPELIACLHRKIRPGGELFFQSDVWELALDALATVEEQPERFANIAGPWSFVRENPFGARSLREVRCEARGLRIWRLRYRRLAD